MIELADPSQATTEDCAALLIGLGEEIGLFPTDVKKGTADLYNVMLQNMTFVYRDPTGKIVGIVAIEEVGVRYADAKILKVVYFYVLPEHRGGHVMKELLAVASREAVTRKQMLFFESSHPGNAAKRRTPFALAAQTMGYIPIGFQTRIR